MQRFAIAGIVAEYNPFHNGHRWMIQQLREQGAGTVVCVMSGPFVQRAQPAFLPTFVRAQAALAAGADLVLRLPVPYAVASAEAFATAGVGLLAALGCVDVVAFGAECGDAAPLQEVARLLLSPQFTVALRQQLKSGQSFAAARAAALEELQPGAGRLLATANNILGVEYCKALLAAVPQQLNILGSEQGKDCPHMPRPLALPRKGTGHDGLPADGVASASWLRKQAWQGTGVNALQGWVPAECLPLYQKAIARGQGISLSRWELALLARLRGKRVEDFTAQTGAGEGLGVRLGQASRAAVTEEELYALAKSKRFAHSRVRRVALATALDLPANLPHIPAFIQVLAAGPKGIALLKKAKQKAVLPVSTSLAKLAKLGPQAAKLVQVEAAAEDLYALCQQTPVAGGRAFTQAAWFEKGPVNKTATQ